MGKASFHEFKKQASFFFKAKIRTARLALTDVTTAQLLTEEATSGNPWPPDTPTMGVITKAAFEIDDFCRIVEILRKRLLKFKAKDWRASYNALILLEHLLTHGPQSFSEEFEDDKEVIMKLGSFQFVDETGFNWGSSVRKLSARVLKLLEDKTFLREERSKARSLTRGIEGFGNLSQRSFPRIDSYSGRLPSCNYQSNDRQNDGENNLFFSAATGIFSINKGSERKLQTSENVQRRLKLEPDSESGLSTGGVYSRIDHPFCDFKHQTKESLLSSVEW